VKILAVNWQDPGNPHSGGAEVHLSAILSRLAGSGHDVTLLCSGWSGAAQRAEQDGVDVHRTGTRYSFSVAAPRYYKRHLGRSGFDVIIDDINKVPLFTPLWGHDTPVVALVPHLFGTTAFQELPAPLATVVWLSERPVPLVYRRSLFHAISHSTADDLVARGVRERAITVIYPGIDSESYSPDSEQRSATPLFVYLGRLKKYKGIDIILKAFARAALRDARLHIAGKGDYLPELRALAESLGLGERVSFPGFVFEPEKLALLRSAWSVVFTSPKEGWGITNLEAQACGTPVLASDAPGLRESVLHASSGFLVPHGNIEHLSEMMRRLAGDQGLVETMGARGREFARTFSWERTARETLAHLEMAVRHGG
jgi:glycosyltransferase involved in cell wall biosynthesis